VTQQGRIEGRCLVVSLPAGHGLSSVQGGEPLWEFGSGTVGRSSVKAWRAEAGLAGIPLIGVVLGFRVSMHR
jgi:hypothetical protein